MTSRRQVNKRFLRWQRYWDHYMSEQFVVTPGMLRAYNVWAHAYNNRRKTS